MKLFISINLSTKNFENNKFVNIIIEKIKDYQKENFYESVSVLFINCDENIDYTKLNINLKKNLTLFFLSFKNVNFDYNNFIDFSEESCLFFQCDKLLYSKKNVFDISTFKLDEIFNEKKINFYEKKYYLKKMNDNYYYRTLRICFFKLIKVEKNIYTLKNTRLSKKVLNKKNIHPFNKSINYFNFRTSLGLSHNFNSDRILPIFISGIIVKLYLLVNQLIPRWMKRYTDKIIKFFLGKFVKIVAKYEKERIARGTGLLKISKYYANKMTFYVIFKKIIYIFFLVKSK